MNESRCITGGIFYCRDSTEMKGCGSLQTSSWFDSEVLRNRQQKHTANRYHALKKRYDEKSILNNSILVFSMYTITWAKHKSSFVCVR